MHGPVRAPRDAATGKATMVVELPPTSKFRSYPTTIDVVIE